MPRGERPQTILETADHLFELTTCETDQQISAYLETICNAYGFTSFGLSSIPLPGEKMDPVYLLSGWEDEWLDRYMSNDYIHSDPVIQKIQSSYDPFKWRDVVKDRKLSPQSQRVMNEAQEFGMIAGFAIPMHGIRGCSAVVTFGTDHYEIGFKDEAMLHMIGIYAHHQLHKIRDSAVISKRLESAQRLTPRERECIRWASEGKTYEDIGIILGVSSKMVEVHMSRASAKMDTCDKAHLVAESIRCGIIR